MKSAFQCVVFTIALKSFLVHLEALICSIFKKSTSLISGTEASLEKTTKIKSVAHVKVNPIDQTTIRPKCVEERVESVV
jgi:hypothetical protein